VEVLFRLETLGRTQPVITTGRSVTAGKQKVYIEVETKQADRGALMKMICDGETFYRIESLAGKNSLLTYGLADLKSALERLATTEAERVAKEDVEKEQQGRHGFEGVAAMVKDLRTRMDFAAPQVTTATVNGKTHGVKIVQGEWSKDVLDILIPSRKSDYPQQPDPRELWNKREGFFNLPRLARFYFDSTSNDLLRVELVGIREKHGSEAILSVVYLEKITPLTKLEESMFKPTTAEMAYERVQIDLTTYLRSEHQEMMKRLKALQEMQNQASGAGK
jgi:hypothetical protein